VDAVSYKTANLNSTSVAKNWVIVDAENQVLGRLCSEVAKVIRGKHKPGYTPHVDCGDNVIVINAGKIKLTGRKMNQKEYVRHTGHPGGQRFATPADWLKKNPALIIEHAVKGMLPKGRLGRALNTNLFIYAGAEHPHTAQKPKAITFA
jgi:large subunit ribosomal protein L13